MHQAASASTASMGRPAMLKLDSVITLGTLAADPQTHHLALAELLRSICGCWKSDVFH